MKSTQNRYRLLGAGLCMGIIILDSKTAAAGARAGLELCTRAVIPALFPFLLLSAMVTGNMAGRRLPFLRPVGRLCGIPDGAELLLITGALGGYPLGAQAVTQAWKSGQLSKDTARRMLGFCSNAGPSFLFGILGPFFSDPSVCWWLWGIHLLSALLTAMVLPRKEESSMQAETSDSLSLPEALQRSLQTMATICGWVLVFRILIEFCRRWFLWLLPEPVQVLCMGLLELTNGCTALSYVESEATRFLLCAAMLGLGGVCVGMQTVSVVGNLGTGAYFPGKLLQAGFSICLAIIVQSFLYPEGISTVVLLWLIPILLIPALLLHNRKNFSSIFRYQGV